MTQSFVMSFAPPLITKVGTLITESRSIIVHAASGPPLQYHKCDFSVYVYVVLLRFAYHILTSADGSEKVYSKETLSPCGQGLRVQPWAWKYSSNAALKLGSA